MQLQGFLLLFCVGLSLYSQEDDLVKGLRMKVAGPSGAVDVRSVPRLSLAVESGSSATPWRGSRCSGAAAPGGPPPRVGEP